MESAAWSATSHECLLSRVIILSALYFSDLSSLSSLKLFNEFDDTEFHGEVEQTSVPMMQDA